MNFMLVKDQNGKPKLSFAYTDGDNITPEAAQAFLMYQIEAHLSEIAERVAGIDSTLDTMSLEQ